MNNKFNNKLSNNKFNPSLGYKTGVKSKKLVHEWEVGTRVNFIAKSLWFAYSTILFSGARNLTYLRLDRSVTKCSAQ